MVSGLDQQITVGIKHTSLFGRRRQMLALLLQSIREKYGDSMRIVVADDGGMADISTLQSWRADFLRLPPGSGLGYGRNALVRATTTPYFVLLDDDVLFHGATSLRVLWDALQRNPDAVLAAGCYFDLRFGRDDCFSLLFDTEEAGAIVRAHPAPSSPPGALPTCVRVHAAHNFFLARTAALAQYGWDARQRVMEHETFFYQLFLNDQPVLACGHVSVGHNTTRDDEYRERSFRLKEQQFMQYLCKNFPEVSRFHTPYLEWRCDARLCCAAAWHAQFAYDGRKCLPMQWDGDDSSVVHRPLIIAPIQPSGRFAALELEPNRNRSSHIPLLVLVLTEQRNVARRAWQRATWLSFAWHRGYLERELVPWRHLYIMAREKQASRGRGMRPELLDQVIGDTVTLSRVTEGYKNLVFKTMEAFRWALRHTSFDVLLKTDDDSMVHVGRLWAWLVVERPKAQRPQPLERIYAGRIFRRSQVIRRNFTRADLWHPDWYPRSFRKWAVDEEVFAPVAYPPYCGGGGYLVGHAVAVGILAEYDAHPRHKVIKVEDAFVGVLASSTGVVPTEIPTFQEPPRGTLQTREMFIDQILIHRIVEPAKAFRWLMLSANCHAGPRECARQHNRTHGLPVEGGSEDGQLEYGLDAYHDRDWVSGPIPRAHRNAVTGTEASFGATSGTDVASRDRHGGSDQKGRVPGRRRKRGNWKGARPGRRSRDG